MTKASKKDSPVRSKTTERTRIGEPVYARDDVAEALRIWKEEKQKKAADKIQATIKGHASRKQFQKLKTGKYVQNLVGSMVENASKAIVKKEGSSSKPVEPIISEDVKASSSKPVKPTISEHVKASASQPSKKKDDDDGADSDETAKTSTVDSQNMAAHKKKLTVEFKFPNDVINSIGYRGITKDRYAILDEIAKELHQKNMKDQYLESVSTSNGAGKNRSVKSALLLNIELERINKLKLKNSK